MLLGIARDGDGLAVRVLLDHGIDTWQLRNRILRAGGGVPWPDPDAIPTLAAHLELAAAML